MPEFEPVDNKKYKVKAIQNSAIYAKKTNKQPLGLYYLVAWKGYPKEKSTWKPSSAVMQLRKLLSKFHHENPDKPTVTSPPIDASPPIAKPAIQLPAKRKREQPTGRAKKYAKWGTKKKSESVRFFSRARSRQVAWDLSPGCKKRRKPT